MKIQDVKRQGWEQGNKQGLEEGVRGGEMEGPATFIAMEPRGPERTRVIWSLGSKRPQHARARQAQADKAARKQGVATSATSAEIQTHIHSTEEGENAGEEPVVRSGWMSMYACMKTKLPHWSV